MPSTQNLTGFDNVYAHLTSIYGFPVAPRKSPRPHESTISHTIADMSLHPTLEALLHILNADLPSAHFLCRHMQNAPAWEGVYIHGLLHRVEGDYENAKAWYGDVAHSEAFTHAWPEGLDKAKSFLDDVKTASRSPGGKGVNQELIDLSQREIDRLSEWCKQQFGVKKVDDATQVWVEPGEKEREIAAKMLVGGEGWRQF